MKRLIYFNHGLVQANGQTDPLYLLEKPWLEKHFDHVEVVGENGCAHLEDTNENGFYQRAAQFSRLRAAVMVLFQKEVWHEIAHMRRDGKLNWQNLKELLHFAAQGYRMFLHAKHLLTGHDQVTLYSFWMSFDGYAAALCKKLMPKARFVVRCHSFDVDIERIKLNPYLMKQMTIDQADGVYPISQVAKEQLLSYMKGRMDESKLQVLAVGSGGRPLEEPKQAPMYSRGILRVVSCAMISPNKQIEMLVEALAMWEGCPLYWTHIGGGEGLEDLRRMADFKLRHKENVIAEMLGTLEIDDILKLYETHAFDVFVNTSRMEGMPISIMEAMHHGTLIVAPSVGGIPELITPEVGWLYDPEDGAEGVLRALEAVAALTQEEAEEKRQATRDYWKEHCANWTLLEKLFPDTRPVRR